MSKLLVLCTFVTVAASAFAQRFAVEAAGSGRQVQAIDLLAQNNMGKVSGHFQANLLDMGSIVQMRGGVVSLTWNPLVSGLDFEANCLDLAGRSYKVEGTVADRGPATLDFIVVRVTVQNRFLVVERSQEQAVTILLYPQG